MGDILDSVTWKAHMHWAGDLGASEQELKEANKDSTALMSQLKDEFFSNAKPIVLNVIIGPKGNAYTQKRKLPSMHQRHWMPMILLNLAISMW
jgi:homocysteine S-methyltransferase